MGRHSAELDMPWDTPSWEIPLDQLPTEPIEIKPSYVGPVLVMFFGFLAAAGVMLLVIKRFDAISAVSGFLLIGAVAISYVTAMLGMLLLHWRSL
jgi:hypothetical protein